MLKNVISKIVATTAITVLASAALPVAATVVTTNQTASINNYSFGDTTVGNHFHVNVGDGVAVNYFDNERGKGFAEFDLAGVTAGKAVLSFKVSSFSDIYTNLPHAYFFPVSIFAYVGDNLIEFSDYLTPTLGTVGSFATVGLEIGDSLSFDVTDFLAEVLGTGATSLGFLFQSANLVGPQSAIRFGDVTLTVPEPSSVALLALGLAGVAVSRKRKPKA
ncbi:MAG: hypothetical protein JWP29_1212 [Rhodoferax sp.]|nr:hypothetical protein [Rhodoferax sp.]